jgi:hypothetical protein
MASGSVLVRRKHDDHQFVAGDALACDRPFQQRHGIFGVGCIPAGESELAVVQPHDQGRARGAVAAAVIRSYRPHRDQRRLLDEAERELKPF